MRYNICEPVLQHSPFGGQLLLEEVAGATSGNLNPENDVQVACGQDRSMYVYVPRSGCPHAKQTAVLMVLRDGGDEASASALLHSLGLDALAEENHFIVVFPNPLQGGWNYGLDAGREDDADFIVRCFAALPKSKGGVAGFNGMIFHLATSEAASAMVATLAATRSLDAAAIMVGPLPEGYAIPEGPHARQVAWLCGECPQLAAHLDEADGKTAESVPAEGITCHASASNPCIRWYEDGHGLDAGRLALAWDLMFSETRRWRNDTYGTYQPRTHMDELGFVAHVDDTTLGLADGLGRTWFEYVPPCVRESAEPAPLVIYLHGINCCGSYGAEQSGWDVIARRDGLMVAYPTATIENRWNGWDDPRLPSDMAYILSLIDHMDEVHPVDRTRIYVSGFSMGSMFSNALAAAHPDVFAGVIAMNGPHWGYFGTLDSMKPSLLSFNPRSVVASIPESDEKESRTRQLADAAKQRHVFRMPIVQFVGLLDNVGLGRGEKWPIDGGGDQSWPRTVGYWVSYNNGPDTVGNDAQSPTGFASDTCKRVGKRMIEQGWHSHDEGSPILYRLVSVERLPHAVDLDEIEHGWDIIRHYRRLPNGELACI